MTDPRDPAGSNNAVAGNPACPACPPTTTRSLLVLPVQKSVANVTDGSASAGDILETTVTIQLSDFFAIDDVSMFDVLSDGQRLTGNPQISFTQHGASFSGAVVPGAFEVREYFSGGNPGVGGLPDPNAPAVPGDTVLAIDLSQALLADLGLNQLLGGCVPVGGTGGPLPDCSVFNAGTTTGTLTYQTTIQDSFTDAFPSGDASVDLGDQLHTQVFLEAATVLNTANLAPTGSPSAVVGTGAAGEALVAGTLSTTLYAITDAGTGVTTLNPVGVPPAGPGDVLTFRLRVELPSADFEDLRLWDFLPLPALEANQIVSFADTIADGTTTLGTGIPAVGVAMWGPSGVTDGVVNFRSRLAALGTTLENGTTTPTLTGPGGTVPAACGGVAIAASESAVNFCFGDFDDPGNGPSVIDILFSVTRINTAGIAANGPRLVSLARLETAATNAPGTAAEALVELSLALVADLSISVTDGVATAVPGNQITYTIVASNAGPEPVSGVSVADVFPGTLSCSTTSVAAGGATGNTTGPFVGNIADSVALPAGGSVTYTSVCDIAPAATGSLSNTATITAPIGASDPVPGNNSATDTDTLTPQIDASITKTDGAASSVPGQSIVYTIVAGNAGPSVATGVAISDTFPGSLTGCSWTSVGAGGATGNTAGPVNGNIAETGIVLPAGATVTYTVTCTVDPAARGSLANTASVSSATTDPTPGNNSATDTNTLTPQIDLVVSKVESADPVTAGGADLTYTVTVLNNGPSSATSVALSEVLTLPTGVTVGSITPSQGSFAAPTWSVGTLAPTGSATLSVVLDIASSAAVGTDTICDTATVTGAAENLVNTGDDSATECTSITRLVDIVVTKVESIDPVAAGSGVGNLTYTVTVANSGPSDASGISVTEVLTLPAGVSVDSITPSAGSYTTPTWSLGGLTAGDQATLAVILTAGASTDVGTDVICNTSTLATVTETQSSTANDSDNECTSVVRTADLSITKVDAEDPPSGSTIFYTVTVTNAGPSDATGVVVTDTFPFAFLTNPLTVGCAEGDKGIPTCTLPDTPAGGSAQFTIEATIIPPPPGVITNTVSVTANEPDPNLGDNEDSEDTTFDTTAPTVEQVTSIAPTRDGELDDCDTVLGAVSSLRATFSETMATAGAGNIALTSQWRLVQPGPGAPFVTSDCSGFTGTDTVVALDSVSWNPATLAATVTVASPPLADGQYRLLICETATDPSGNPLAGDGSTPGTPLLRTFRVDRFNALENAHFDTTSGCSTAPWTSASPAQLEVDTVDRNSVPTSGSAHNALSTAGFDLGQCVPILGGRLHDFEASIRTTVSGGLVGFERACNYYATPNCSGASLGENVFPLVLGSTGAGFFYLAQSVTPPVGAASALCTLVVSAPAGAVPYGAWLDQLFFGDRRTIFADGFESGDTSTWSAELPPPVEP